MPTAPLRDNEFSQPKPVISPSHRCPRLSPFAALRVWLERRPFAALRVTEGERYHRRGVPILIVKIHHRGRGLGTVCHDTSGYLPPGRVPTTPLDDPHNVSISITGPTDAQLFCETASRRLCRMGLQ